MNRIPAILALAAATLLVAAASAMAGTYTVTACNDAPGNVNHSWTSGNTDPAALTTALVCPSSGWQMNQLQLSGIAAADIPGAIGAIPAGARAGWTFNAPAGTTITALSYERGLGQQAYNDKVPALRDGSGNVIGGETCIMGPIDTSCGRGSSLATLNAAASFTGLSTSSLWFGVECVPVGGASVCTNGATLHEGSFVVYGATVTLSETSAPAIGTTSGSLTSGEWLQGTGALQLASATDASGIRSLNVSIDGGATRTASPTPAACDFTFAAPCQDAGSSSWNVDTPTLADGPHTATVSATNAAGVTATRTITFRSDNTPPAAPATVSSAVGDDWQSASATAHLSWPLPNQDAGSPVDDARVTICHVGGACAAPVDASSFTSTDVSLAPGSYTAAVELHDAAGWGSSRTTTLRYDPTPPAAPVAVASSAENWQSSPNVAMTVTPPNVDADHAPVAATVAQVCAEDGTSCGPLQRLDTPTGGTVELPEQGRQEIRVWERSAAGVDDPATAVVAAALYSSTPPTARISDLQPADGSASRAFSASWTAAPGGPAPVDHVHWTLCQATSCPFSGDSTSGSAAADLPSAGTWTLTLTPVDVAGVSGTTVARSFTVTTPPDDDHDGDDNGDDGGGGGGGTGTSTTPTQTVTAPTAFPATPSTTTPSPGPSRPGPAASKLRIAAATLRAGKLSLRLTAVRTLTLKVRVVVIYGAGHRTRSRTVTVTVRRGTGGSTVRLTAGASAIQVTARLAGTSSVRAITLRRTIHAARAATRGRTR